VHHNDFLPYDWRTFVPFQRRRIIGIVERVVLVRELVHYISVDLFSTLVDVHLKCRNATHTHN
jgi:hypothetical protein